MEIDYNKSLIHNALSNLVQEKELLLYEISLKEARISQLEGVIIDLYHKIDRLINEADTGEDI